MLFEDISFLTSIDGVGDEVLCCFFTLGLAALVYGIWRTTSVEESLLSNGSQEVPLPEADIRSPEPEEEVPPEADPPQDESTVQIRLKFLDESVKEVSSHLSESFGRFKRRHFPREVEENQLIRLVFNGRFLQGDSSSLRSLGLFDNCVCHVLIQAGPPPTSAPPPPVAPNPSPTLMAEDLDLSTLCYPLLGSLISLIWWFQIVYGQYFHLTSTISLIFMTVVYVFSLAVQLY